MEDVGAISYGMLRKRESPLPSLGLETFQLDTDLGTDRRIHKSDLSKDFWNLFIRTVNIFA